MGEFFIGDRYVEYYTTRDSKYLDFEIHEGKDGRKIDYYQDGKHPDWYAYAGWQLLHPIHVWPVGPVLSSISKHIFYFTFGLDPVDSHRYFLLLITCGILALLYHFCHKYFNCYIGLYAVVLLALLPRFWGHAHHNIKDILNCFTTLLFLFLFIKAVRHKSPRFFIFAALAYGLGMATKANILLMPFIVIPYFLMVLHTNKSQIKSWFSKSLVISYCLFPIISFLIFFLLWPYLWINPVDKISAYIDYIFNRGFNNDRPSYAVFTTLAAIPAAILPFTFAGIFFAIRSIYLKRKSALYLLLLLWVVIPLGRLSMPNAATYDGVRLWLDVFIPLMILSAIGYENTIKRLFNLPSIKALNPVRKQLIRMFAILFILIPTLSWTIKNHPLQMLHMNPIAQQLNPEANKARDYWTLSYRLGLRWLNEYADKSSLLMIGFNQNVVHPMKAFWIRDDIKVMRLFIYQGSNNLIKENLHIINDSKGAVYLMTVDSHMKEISIVNEIRQQKNPIHTIKHKQQVILEIFKLK
ncbi:MAG: glycosyltransferase family 39 protein [Lentisphaeria bacterium]|nr:glycosyltransferase family 39 protein [Lentisphaeria bacterium]